MAVSAIAKVVMTLFKKHGIARGASMAQKLGFKNKDIKAAFSQLGAKRKPKRSSTPRFLDEDDFTPSRKELGRMREARRKAREHFDRYGQEVDPIY